MAEVNEFHFLLDASGALVVFQPKGASWAGVVAFSSEERAREFIRASGVDAREIAVIASRDSDSIAELVRNLKRRAVRNLLLDLDYASGECIAIEFEGDSLGIAHPHRFVPGAQDRKD